MGLTFNGTTIPETDSSLPFNGVDIEEVTFNGTTVWAVPQELTWSGDSLAGSGSNFGLDTDGNTLRFRDGFAFGDVITVDLNGNFSGGESIVGTSINRRGISVSNNTMRVIFENVEASNFVTYTASTGMFSGFSSRTTGLVTIRLETNSQGQIRFVSIVSGTTTTGDWISLS